MGFTSPSALRAYHEAHKTDSLHDRILETMALAKGEQTTLAIIGECYAKGIAAPSTAHRALKYLMSIGFVQTGEAADARVRPLSVTEAGREYLRGWVEGGGEPS
jgi:hypothetical protein